jgi:hypothetical protein
MPGISTSRRRRSGFLRFRGRHLARDRQFEHAVADYRRAAELVEDVQDSFEPDDIINPRNQSSARTDSVPRIGVSFVRRDVETDFARVLEDAPRSAEPAPQRRDAARKYCSVR